MRTGENVRDGHILDGQLINVFMMLSIHGGITYRKLIPSLKPRKDSVFGASLSMIYNNESNNH